jgi:hypothetical protein
MLQDLPIPSPLSPIQRSTSDERIATFQAQSNSIYNKYSPFTTYSIGPSQPFIYTKISDSSVLKNFTKYDTYAAPIGSTARDLKRIGQFSVTGNGILYLGKQLYLQKENAFNETRIYNPLSLLKATARPASLGLIDYPQRHLETSGGLLNFFKDALLSTIGFENKDSKTPTIEGTATGRNGQTPYSAYTGAHGGARAGLMRLGTAKAASSIFESTWVTNPSQDGTNGGFLANLGKSLVNKLKSLIPSTNPLGAFGGTSSESWEFRPEYKKGKDGVYYSFLADNSGFMTVNAPASQLFYNDRTFASANAAQRSTVKIASDFHKYYPQKQTDASSRVWYANPSKVSADEVGISDVDGNMNNLKSLQERMVKSIDSFKEGTANQFRRSAERYSEVKDAKGNKYPTYNDIPSTEDKKYELRIENIKGAIPIRKRGFAEATAYSRIQQGKTTGEDSYNTLEMLSGKRNEIPKELLYNDPNQSKDLIFFYFYDLINEMYIPFRATIKGLSDQHSAEWEEISYIGRADKLFMYKGFSRDVNFSFTVYANSAKEMLPMWERINYLVGLTRPSKYTALPNKPMSAKQKVGDVGGQEAANARIEELNKINTNETTGREGKFIYPPMTTFRLGDMYVDQPCIISSVGVNVSDDANWESLRGDDYSYIYKQYSDDISSKGTKSRQLPLQVDVSVTLKILEKALSLGSNAHFGKTEYDLSGNETKRWVL